MKDDYFPTVTENGAPDFLCLPGSLVTHVRMFYLSERHSAQLPDPLCCHASRSGTRPRRTLSVTSPTVPASHMPAGELEVADGVDGGVLVGVCTVEMKVWRMVPLHNTRLDGASVCLHGGALMAVTGVGSCVRAEVTRFLPSRGVCRGSYQLKQQIG